MYFFCLLKMQGAGILSHLGYLYLKSRTQAQIGSVALGTHSKLCCSSYKQWFLEHIIFGSY